jgi:S1-C subfamily serine protease
MRSPYGAVIAITIATVAGCGGNSNDRPAASAAVDPAARLDLGVVGIAARIGGDEVRSSGVVIDSSNGLVLTSARGIWGAKSLKVTTGLAVLYGRIVARDACDDLALIETQPRVPGLVSIPASSDASVKGAESLVAVTRRPGLPSRTGPELLTAPVRPGSKPERSALIPGIRPAGAVPLAGAAGTLASGAPIVGADGRLTGMLQLGSDGRRAALPWKTINARLQELRPGGNSVYVGWKRHYRCADALHRFTAAHHPRFRTGDVRLNRPVPATRLPGTAGVDG